MIEKISNLISQYKSIIPSDELIKNVVMETVNDYPNINCRKKEIVVRGNKIFLKTSAVKRNFLFVKKNEITNKIKERTGKNYGLFF